MLQRFYKQLMDSVLVFLYFKYLRFSLGVFHLFLSISGLIHLTQSNTFVSDLLLHVYMYVYINVRSDWNQIVHLFQQFLSERIKECNWIRLINVCFFSLQTIYVNNVVCRRIFKKKWAPTFHKVPQTSVLYMYICLVTGIVSHINMLSIKS